jgi:hypothetical protein
MNQSTLMFGITAYSVYVPRYRLDRSLIARAWGTAQAAGEIAVANYDEDALTMATDAALACAPDAEAGAVDALYFAPDQSQRRIEILRPPHRGERGTDDLALQLFDALVVR